MKRFILMAAASIILCGCKEMQKGNDESTLYSGRMVQTTDIGEAVKQEPDEVIRLYEGKAPESEEWTHHEMRYGEYGKEIFNVVDPDLALYLPEPGKANGSAMIICPGGAFLGLSYVSEGIMVAQELCARGMTCFVLKYRTTPILDEQGNGTDDENIIQRMVMEVMGPALSGQTPSTEVCLSLKYSHLAFADADRAVSVVRQNAAKWNINPDKIGIMGFSAGAVTAMHQALMHSESSKPNFTGVIYGGWTKDVKAPADAQPVFLCAPVTDIFSPDETIDVFKAWREAKVPVELHYYQESTHGFGSVPTGKSSDLWVEEMYRFMQDVQFVN